MKLKLAFNKELDLMKKDRDILNTFLNYLSFQAACELEISKQNFEAQEAITTRAKITLN